MAGEARRKKTKAFSVTVAPGDDIQAAIDKVVAHGQGSVHLLDGEYLLTGKCFVTDGVGVSNTIPGTKPKSGPFKKTKAKKGT